MTREPSAYQKAIYQAIVEGDGDLMVEAVPGSGKTTTIVDAASMIPGTGLSVAFNKAIAMELGERLPSNVEACTIHSLGMRALQQGLKARPRVTEYKYKDYLKDSVGKRIMDRKMMFEVVDAAHDLLNMAQLTLTNYEDEDALREMALDHDLDLIHWSRTWPEVAPALRRGLKEMPKTISFNDMIWAPLQMDLYPMQSPMVFVDEAQDLNAAQREWVLRARYEDGGRFVFVGDSRQAIYGFAGADTSSMGTIKEKTAARSLPLSICYRCPTSHIELANAIYPGIEPAPWAAEGLIARDLDKEDVIDLMRERTPGRKDIILCRLTAPVVSVCYSLLRENIPARVRGRDIGKNLKSIVGRIEKLWPGQKISANFGQMLNDYENKQADEIKAKGNGHTEMALAALNDKINTIFAIYDGSGAQTFEELNAAIDSLFAENPDKTCVDLATIHRTKGLEADRVVFLDDHLCPFPRAKTPAQLEQEWNLRYVALTRSKSELYFADSGMNMGKGSAKRKGGETVAVPEIKEPVGIGGRFSIVDDIPF